MKRKIALMSFSMLPCALALANVDFASLLAELNDRDAITRLPRPAYSMKLWSSHARTAETPGTVAWFDNHDFDNFCGAVTNTAGDVEKILVAAEGPGALVRFWFAGNAYNASLKIYLDGSDDPTFAGPLRDLVGGTALCPPPLSAALAEATADLKRGRNLYLPIPYAKSCRVTMCALPGQAVTNLFYYNIEARTYAPGTPVTTLTKAALAAARDLVADANARLADVAPSLSDLESRHFDGTLRPGDVKTVRFDGPGAIRLLRLKPVAPEDFSTRWWKCQRLQLRKLQLELTFDGVTTVKMPVGAFFNTGYWSAEPHATRFTRVTEGGVLEARWVMPFAQGCALRLSNTGDSPIVLSDTEIAKGRYAIDDRTLRFGATFVARAHISTRKDGEAFDLTIDNQTGRGIFVGAGVIVSNPAREWWGEGDEKIFIDGETIPSYVGTGTEDYFGYAWCRSAPFSHPLLAQPAGDANGQAPSMGGYSVNFRGRALDAIPFTRSFRHDFELWHWADTYIDYDSVAYHYLAR